MRKSLKSNGRTAKSSLVSILPSHMSSQLSRLTAKQHQPPIEEADPSTMTQENRSQLISESSHSPSTESMCYPSWEALESSFTSIFASRMSYLGLDPDLYSDTALPPTKGFRSRRPPAIETSWDTMTTADEPSSYIQEPPTPKNSQSGHFFGTSPRSVMDSPESVRKQFF
jgi:hypothetical protein